MGFLGGQELLIILAIVLILFGAKKIPELASGLGKGIREFRNASNEIKNEIDHVAEEKSEAQDKNSDNIMPDQKQIS